MKKLTVIGLAFLLILALTACGGSGASESASAEPADQTASEEIASSETEDASDPEPETQSEPTEETESEEAETPDASAQGILVDFTNAEFTESVNAGEFFTELVDIPGSQYRYQIKKTVYTDTNSYTVFQYQGDCNIVK